MFLGATMSRLDLQEDEERLTLSLPFERQMLTAGCPLFVFSALCLLVLAVMSVVHDTHFDGTRSGVELGRFFGPHSNEFGFLWLVGAVLLAVFVPLYVFLVRRISAIFCFDRERGLFLRHGRTVTKLRRVENLRVRRQGDMDDEPMFQVLVIWGDGRETLIDEMEDEAAASVLAQRIADYLAVPVHSARMQETGI